MGEAEEGAYEYISIRSKNDKPLSERTIDGIYNLLYGPHLAFTGIGEHQISEVGYDEEKIKSADGKEYMDPVMEVDFRPSISRDAAQRLCSLIESNFDMCVIRVGVRQRGLAEISESPSQQQS